MTEQFFNYKEAIERLDGDEEFLLELLNELVEQIDENWPALQNVVSGKNYSELRAVAHSIKGAAANLNVEMLAAVFYELEEMGRSESMDGVEESMEKAKAYTERLREFLKDPKV